MRPCKKRREVLTRLLGWRAAPGQAEGLAVGKQLRLAWEQQGAFSATPLHATQMELFAALFPLLTWPLFCARSFVLYLRPLVCFPALTSGNIDSARSSRGLSGPSGLRPSVRLLQINLSAAALAGLRSQQTANVQLAQAGREV